MCVNVRKMCKKSDRSMAMGLGAMGAPQKEIQNVRKRPTKSIIDRSCHVSMCRRKVSIVEGPTSRMW